MQRTELEVRRSIDRYKTTGKLPRDYDVFTVAHNPSWSGNAGLGENPEVNYLENTPERRRFESNDAEALGANMKEFLDSLTPKQRKVYDLNMAGGLSYAETGMILGLDKGAIQKHVNLIRAKAKRVIEEDGIRMAQI